jgi:hypothetical protein
MEFSNVSLEDKKAFAKSQYQFLKDKGIKGRMHRSRIFKAAGPGQIQEAYKLSESENWEDPSRKDLLYCIFSGVVYNRLERERAENLLKKFNFYVPRVHNDYCFYRCLRGTGEIMFPNFYNFSERELREIENGLEKRVYED